ncbi:MAG: GTPase ObgE [Desulfobacteraceae bacterium]|nr:GTPase ObgE [Desulfobacteraceae bacterium]MCF8095148.1 GTPase ObgE [Desulfobacteraceae bacterium]
MKFVDEVSIDVAAGHGGRGCVSFRREKYVPRGGPDGGDGGNGGDVIVRTSERLRTLHRFRYKRNFKADDGDHGQGKQKTGKNGKVLVIEVPPGTVISDAQTGQLVCDCTIPGQNIVVARGGQGGRGNRRFATSTNRAPRHAQPGQAGETRVLKLDLKLLADIGIVGFPNAGKSTLISRISSARPKIADYPFTTISPVLGVVAPQQGEPFVVADIPGLIEGAHQGAGLGIHFLRHVERTRILLHMVDASALEPENPLASYEAVNKELAGFSPELLEKPQILVLNKMDLPQASDAAKRFVRSAGDLPVYEISAATGKGVDLLVNALNEMVNTREEADGS